MSDTSVQNFGNIGGPTLRAQGAQTIYQFGRHRGGASSSNVGSIMPSPSGELARAVARDLRSDMKRGERRLPRGEVWLTFPSWAGGSRRAAGDCMAGGGAPPSRRFDTGELKDVTATSLGKSRFSRFMPLRRRKC